MKDANEIAREIIEGFLITFYRGIRPEPLIPDNDEEIILRRIAAAIEADRASRVPSEERLAAVWPSEHECTVAAVKQTWSGTLTMQDAIIRGFVNGCDWLRARVSL